MKARRLFHACLVLFLFAGGVLAPFQAHSAMADAIAPSPSYVFRRSFGGEGSLIFRPTNIALDKNGRVFVFNSTSYSHTDRVTVFTPDNSTQRVWGGEGSAPGMMANPNDIVLGPNGKVYIADTGNQRVQVFTWDGALQDAWSTNFDGSGVAPNGIALSPD